MRSEATVLSLLSGLAPPLPVGPVTERLPMPGAATIEVKVKSKVENLYRGSYDTSLQNRYYNTPLVHWTHE